MTAEAFLRWDHTGIAEWVDGEVSIQAVTNEHQRIVAFLIQFMGLFCRVFKLGVVRSAPYAMRSLTSCIREPDLMFISTANLSGMRPEALDGPADLVVEVVSEESVARDYDEKLSEFEAAGVQEYWLIDPRANRQRAAFYQRTTSGRFQPVRTDDRDVYSSADLPGFRLKLEWLWQSEPEPDALTALAEIIGSTNSPRRCAAGSKQLAKDLAKRGDAASTSMSDALLSNSAASGFTRWPSSSALSEPRAPSATDHVFSAVLGLAFIRPISC